jgi:glycosyltransferase involved in cell wall biosynthesis
MHKPRYVMISSEVRRDLEQPLEHFKRLEVYHLYNRAPWNDLREGDFQQRTRRFGSPLSLFLLLREIRPDIVQGPEPMSALMFPYLCATFVYLLLNPHVKLVTASLEAIPLEKKYPWPILWPMKLVLPFWFRRAMVIFYLEGGAKYNLESGGAPPEKMVHHLYGSWGVNLRECNPEGPRVRYAKPYPVILNVGRMVPLKGAHVLIEAYRRLRERGLEATLALVGDGPERARLEAQAQATGYGEDIVFHGTVKNAELPDYLRAASVFVMPSLSGKIWTQQLSSATWQAMACGKPVVVSDIGRMAEFTPPEAGFLVPENDPQALSDALARLIADPELLRRMSEAALNYAHARFDDAKNIARVEEIILERAGFATPAAEVSS